MKMNSNLITIVNPPAGGTAGGWSGKQLWFNPSTGGRGAALVFKPIDLPCFSFMMFYNRKILMPEFHYFI
jgi:hypothetical protein